MLTLKISDKFITGRKKFLLGLQIFIALFSFGIVFSILKNSVSFFIIAFSCVIYITILEMLLWFISNLMLKKMKDISINITDDGIERKSGTFTEKILFSNISLATIIKNNTEETLSINLLSSDGVMDIGGYDNLNYLLDKLNLKIDPTKITSKKEGYGKAVIQIAGIIIGLIIFTLILQKAGLGHFSDRIFQILFGFFILFYKPISRVRGTNFRKYELIFSIAVIILNILSLLGDIIIK
jgi:hypothetical protein